MAEHKSGFVHGADPPADTRADAFQRGIHQRDVDDRLVTAGQRHAGDVHAVAAPGPEPLEPPLVVTSPGLCAHHVDRPERDRGPLWVLAQAAPDRAQAITQVLVEHVRISRGGADWRLLEADAVDSQNTQFLAVSHEIPLQDVRTVPAASSELIPR